MVSHKIRHQLFLDADLSTRLEALAAKPGATKSSILADAVTAWLDRRGANELDDRFSIRLNRMSAALSRIERAGHVQLETLALFIRYELAIHPPLAQNDEVGRALGRERFRAFVLQVGRSVASGKRSLGDVSEEEQSQ